MCSQTGCYDKCETINVFYDNFCVCLFDGWKSSPYCILAFLPYFKLMKNETDFWKKLFLTSFVKLCLTVLFAICSLKSVRDVKIHCSVTICKIFEEFFLLPISLSKIFWTLIKELQNWNCIIMVTNSLKERKIDSKKGKFWSDICLFYCVYLLLKKWLFIVAYKFMFSIVEQYAWLLDMLPL